MPSEIHTNGRVTPEQVTAIAAPEDDGEAASLRTEAIAQIRRKRRFKVHLIVIAGVTCFVGLSWMLTEYYTAHTWHRWPSSFADAPADRPGVWSTWFFYFVSAMLVVIAIDAYRTYARPYMRRQVTSEEVDREVERLTAKR